MSDIRRNIAFPVFLLVIFAFLLLLFLMVWLWGGSDSGEAVLEQASGTSGGERSRRPATQREAPAAGYAGENAPAAGEPDAPVPPAEGEATSAWDERTVAEAYALNDPLIVWAIHRRSTNHESRITNHASFLSVDQPNIVIETIKQAEDGHGVIVRLYERQRRRGEFTLTAAFLLAEAWRTNLLEENQERLDVDDCQLRVPIKPHQIVTLRLILSGQ